METLQRERDYSTFDAALFFSVLRAEGCNPVVRDGALSMNLRENSVIVRDAGRWAALHDPTGEVRLEYARSAWVERHPRTEIVELG